MENPENLFLDSGLTLEEIREQLEANCDDVQEKEFIKPFTDEERDKEKILLSEETEVIYDLSDKLKKVSDPIKEEIKTAKLRERNQRDLIKLDGYPVDGKVYYNFNHETNMAYGYNEEGVLIESRPLTSKERQTNINFLRANR